MTDAFHVHGRELYWRRTRMSDSKVTGKQLERAIGMPFTMRNVTTLRRLAAKYASELMAAAAGNRRAGTNEQRACRRQPMASSVTSSDHCRVSCANVVDCDSPVTILCGSLSNLAG